MTTIIPRADWGARRPKSVHKITVPTSELWLHHTAGALDAGGNGVWWDDVRGIQNFHMDGRGWSDIAYSFIIGGGVVYEGRGAGVAGGHTKDHNTISHAICLIGNYESMTPTDPDLAAIAWLMAHGKAQGWWGDLTGDHSAASGASTACCGTNLRDRMPDLRRMAEGGTAAPTPSPAPPPVVEPATAPTFPLPAGWYFGPRSGPRESVSGYYSYRSSLRDWQVQMQARGWRITADGLYGDETARVARAFQVNKGLSVDGLVGRNTWTTAWTAPVT